MRTRAAKVLMELKPSKIDRGGVGVFAVTDIRKGQRIASGINQEDYRLLILSKNLKNYDREARKKIRDFCIGTPEGFIPPGDLDFNKLSIEWYLNHSCNGNVGFNESGDFVARKNIKQGDELTYDYGLAESNPSFRMRCKCDAKNCRQMITGNDWKKAEFRRKNLEYMLPRLRKPD